MIVYNIVNQLRKFYFDFGVYMGGVKLNKQDQENYKAKLKDMPLFKDVMMKL